MKSVLDGIVGSAGKGFGYLCGLIDDTCYFPRFHLTEVCSEILSHLRPLVSNRPLHCGKNQVLLRKRKESVKLCETVCRLIKDQVSSMTRMDISTTIFHLRCPVSFLN